MNVSLMISFANISFVLARSISNESAKGNLMSSISFVRQIHHTFHR